MSLRPFLEHEETCKVCSSGRPCPRGVALLKDGANRLTRKLLGDPSRAKA